MGNTTFYLCIHPVDTALFFFFTILNNTAVNVSVQVFVWMCGFISLGIYLGMKLMIW